MITVDEELSSIDAGIPHVLESREHFVDHSYLKRQVLVVLEQVCLGQLRGWFLLLGLLGTCVRLSDLLDLRV